MAEESPQSTAPALPLFDVVERPKFTLLNEVMSRKVVIPSIRYNALLKAWLSDPPKKSDIYHVINDEMKIDARLRHMYRDIQLETRPDTPDVSHLLKCHEFLEAFMLGFDSCDAVALCKYDGVYLHRFSIVDVRTLQGEDLKRTIRLLYGKDNKTKNSIENDTNTRIVIRREDIYILGKPTNINIATHALCSLILGSPVDEVYF